MLLVPSPPCTCVRTARSRPSQRSLVVRANVPSFEINGDSQVSSRGRRELLRKSAATLASIALTLSPASAAFAEDGQNLIVETPAVLSAVQQAVAEPLAVSQAVAEPALGDGFLEVEDNLLAYRFIYPVKSASGRSLPIIFSRRPERYSSAAPLSVDARQRIVASLTDLKDAITVGPSSGVLLRTPQQQWSARQVAESVLADRSTSRVSAGQRVSLNTVENAVQEKRKGQLYFVYDHITQGSPNLANSGKETYRRALSVTSTRTGLKDGIEYLYTLNMACPQDLWDDLEPVFKQAIQTFRLLPPGEGFTTPESAPWRFF